MSIKPQKKDFSDIDYRFSFSLTVNDSENNDIIICKRDFNIYNFDEESLYSLELKETIDDIVQLIDSDLKSKSRTYLWYNTPLNMSESNEIGEKKIGVFHGLTEESKEISDELKTSIENDYKNILKFTFFDQGKPVISKILSADAYPFYIRNSIDLTNRKFRSDNVKNIENDFLKQISQKASFGRQDLTTYIIKSISSTCGPSLTRNSKKVIYKQTPQEVNIDNVCLNNDKLSHIHNKLTKIKQIVDDNGRESDIYEVYTTKINFGKRKYNLDTRPTKTQGNK